MFITKRIFLCFFPRNIEVFQASHLFILKAPFKWFQCSAFFSLSLYVLHSALDIYHYQKKREEKKRMIRLFSANKIANNALRLCFEELLKRVDKFPRKFMIITPWRFPGLVIFYSFSHYHKLALYSVYE